jgi:hypothetical protein
LQDIKIRTSGKGVRDTLCEVARIVQKYGYVTLVDEYPEEEFHGYISDLPFDVIKEQPLLTEVKWNRHIAEKAIELYAQGWVAQTELTDDQEKKKAYKIIYEEMKSNMERQLHDRGYFVPFESMRMLVVQRI